MILKIACVVTFYDIVNGTEINFCNVLFNKKLYENISVYNISYKSPTDPERLCIRFNKIDGFFISPDGKIKHLVMLGCGLLDKICDKIKYHICQKGCITHSINYNFGNIKIDSYNCLPVKKILIHNVITLIQPVVNKNENKYYYNIFLEKG